MPAWAIAAIVGNVIAYILFITGLLKVTLIEMDDVPLVDAIFGNTPEFIKAIFMLLELWVVLGMIGGVFYGVGWVLLQLARLLFPWFR